MGPKEIPGRRSAGRQKWRKISFESELDLEEECGHTMGEQRVGGGRHGLEEERSGNQVLTGLMGRKSS